MKRTALLIISTFLSVFINGLAGAEDNVVQTVGLRRGILRRFRADHEQRHFRVVQRQNIDSEDVAEIPTPTDENEKLTPPKPDVSLNEPIQLEPRLIGPQLSEEPTPIEDSVLVEPKSKAPTNLASKKLDETGLSPEMIDLKERIRRCLEYYFDQHESASGRSPWGIMHTLISYGVDTEIYANGRKVNAIGCLCWNGSCRGQRLFSLTRSGGIDVAQGPGVEGHKGQFLAMIAQSRVMRDYPMRIEGREFTVDDLIEHEKATCRPRSELTFKLIGLSHYLDSDATWKDDIGREWSIPRLIKEEMAQPIVGAACGGTHRMMGFAYAVRRREKQNGEITGQWKRAKKYVEDYQDYTFGLQNPDGSFSTNWFEGRGNWGGIGKKLQTTGHILEWMVFSLPKEKLQDERVLRATNFLTNLMLENKTYPWEVGPRGHALRALALYDQRVFEAKKEKEARVAEKETLGVKQ